jgi:D-beta-D-heptose 7-phosphate kinase/D-beta-D-heptose 1-phosphate adenosyltransferase
VKKTISVDEAVQISKELKAKKKRIILVGGCFDILHAGHIKFLNEARKSADFLFLLLESYENIKKFKGDKRPINSQKNRSIVLSALSSVDYIISLESVTKDKDYDKLIVQILPDYIALTIGDKNKKQRLKQCELVGAKLIEIEYVEGISTTTLVNNI